MTVDLSPGLALGIASGALQLAAYTIYAAQVLRAETRPNGMTWLMWAYGTLVFFMIEVDSGAPLPVLILPGVCAAASILVAGFAFARAAYIPPERQDWAILSCDCTIVVGYVVLLYGVHGGEEPGAGQPVALVFILLASVSQMISSWPILRTTYASPEHERPLAWFVWAAAYGVMALAVMAEGLAWAFLAYALLSQAVHLAMGVFAMGARSTERRAS